MDNPGLSTKLDFKFDTSDMEFPDLNFNIKEDPSLHKKTEIKIFTKPTKTKSKNLKELF